MRVDSVQLCRTWATTSLRTQTRVQAGAVTKSPYSLTLFKSMGKTGPRYARMSDSHVCHQAWLSPEPSPAGLTASWQDCPAKRGTVQAALFVLEPCQPAHPKRSFHGHGQGVSRAQLTGKHCSCSTLATLAISVYPSQCSDLHLCQHLALTLGLHACRISCRLLTAQTLVSMCGDMLLVAAQQAELMCIPPAMIAFTVHPAITSRPGNLRLCQRCASYQALGDTHTSAQHVGMNVLPIYSTAAPYIIMNRHTEHIDVHHGTSVHGLQLMMS